MITKALSRLGICPDYCHWLTAIDVAASMLHLALASCVLVVVVVEFCHS